MEAKWKVSPRRWAELWFKALGIITRHWGPKGYEETYTYICPHSLCREKLEATDRIAMIDKIEHHLLEDQKKGLIK